MVTPEGVKGASAESGRRPLGRREGHGSATVVWTYGALLPAVGPGRVHGAPLFFGKTKKRYLYIVHGGNTNG